MADVEPTFTENALRVRGRSAIGSPIELDLVQVNGRCTGKLRSRKPVVRNNRIVNPNGPWINWAATCRRVSM